MSTHPPRIRLTESWKSRLINEFHQPYMQNLRKFLVQEIKAQKKIYPSPDLYFHALNLVPFEKVKVVILGQDPYHGPGQAHGLCFSVPQNFPCPPSLKNIFKELCSDLKLKALPSHGCLLSWTKEGVLLLNTTLTVQAGRAGSHQNQGWETFTDRIIELLNREQKFLVFCLWGRAARTKEAMICSQKHLVLKAAHPSPFSADKGFFGCSHFSKTNTYLKTKNKKPINWQIPDRQINP